MFGKAACPIATANVTGGHGSFHIRCYEGNVDGAPTSEVKAFFSLDSLDITKPSPDPELDKAPALKRYELLKRKMSKGPELAAAVNLKTRDYIQMGYIRRLSASEAEDKRPNDWFLPIFPVTHPNKPEKIRMGFDAAAKVSGVSLNPFLLAGPDLLANDQRSQMILWDGDNTHGDPAVYVVTVMTFGAACLPSRKDAILGEQLIQEELARAEKIVITPIQADVYACEIRSLKKDPSQMQPWKSRVEKSWGIIFTCLTSRAIHLEMAHSLTTASCIMAIRRFFARRGKPLETIGDRGTNFVGSARELEEALQTVDVDAMMDEFVGPEMKWSFNPPAAPHFGGCWERLVRSTCHWTTRWTHRSHQTIYYSETPTSASRPPYLTTVVPPLNQRGEPPNATLTYSGGDGYRNTYPR